MSWHFSRALVEAYSEANSSDGELSAQLRSNPSALIFCVGDRGTGCWNLSQYGATSEHLRGQTGRALLTWYLAGFPVRTSPLEAPPKPALPVSEAGSGPTCEGSLAKWNPSTSSWKTAQLSLFGGWEPYLGTWPRYGIMRDGEFSPLRTLEHSTSVRGALSLPTVTASWDTRGPGLSNNMDNLRASEAVTKFTLRIVKTIGWRWPASLLETIMLWPIGWTQLMPLETDKFRQWLNSHGKP